MKVLPELLQGSHDATSGAVPGAKPVPFSQSFSTKSSCPESRFGRFGNRPNVGQGRVDLALRTCAIGISVESSLSDPLLTLLLTIVRWIALVDD